MKTFDFSKSVIQEVIDEFDRAEKYIKIAMFQIHNDLVIDKLFKKIKEGLIVEIITLPYDSIHENVREHVTERLEKLKSRGGNILFCKWNVGDPERTTTAVGRWYLFHGKFIVTDKAAISLSANFIQTPELDAILIFRNEQDKIQEFNNKFEELKELFIIENNGYEGNIRQKISETKHPRAKEVFALPRGISEVYKKTWIQHYPSELCPKDVNIEEKLYITPFDCRGRNFLMKIIDEAEKFVYISSESFTDKEFPNFLKKIRFKNIEIKLLTEFGSMDFSDRIQIFMKELLAAGVQMNTTREDLHAKLVITDKLIAITSINLNRINLGFKKTGDFWRENTETILICRGHNIIRKARQKYNAIFNASEKIIDKMAERNSSVAGRLFRDVFKIRSGSDAKLFLAKLKLNVDINKEKFLLDVLKLTIKLANNFNVRIISKKEVLMALILNYLSERKHDFNELSEKLDPIIERAEIEPVLDILVSRNLIVKQGEFYKINVDAIF
ncbi:phosphatidylserine/phosphatidylglycerophosphate/cardiolipin synthase family protein [Patescibacteria group bacterium]|nr:phosphatidylserine/phosphatidylglycerophosphate/cardiolipin synthase family protein [Patescibacteria group bacterium]